MLYDSYIAANIKHLIKDYIMTLTEAKKVVFQYKIENDLPTLRQALDHMSVYKHKLPLFQFVAVDIIYRGYSAYSDQL